MALRPARIENREIVVLIEENAEIQKQIEELSRNSPLTAEQSSEIRSLQQRRRENRRQIRDLGYDGSRFDGALGIGLDGPSIESLEQYVAENGPGSLPLAIFNEDGSTTGVAVEDGFQDVELIEGEEATSFLLNRVQGVLAALNEKIVESFFEIDDIRQENIIQITSPDISLLVNIIAKKPSLLPFFKIRTPYFSFIMPKIRLFKRVFERDGSEATELGNLEFKFRSFTSNTKIEQITNSGFGRGDGVGIKNVNWSYEGNNPETVSSFINFDISLFFQNLSDLIEDNIESADAAFRSRENVDLIQLIGAGIGSEGSDDTSPFRFEIEAQLGWELDDSINLDLANDQTIQSIRNIIKDTSVNLRLQLKEHSINFNDDGTLTLDLSYFSAIDQVFSDEKLNILAIGLQERLEAIREADEQERERQLASARERASERRAADVGEDPCAPPRRRGRAENSSEESDSGPSDTEEAILEGLLADGDDSIIQNYNNLFSSILGNNKVYSLSINAEKIIENVAIKIKDADIGVQAASVFRSGGEGRAARVSSRVGNIEALSRYFTQRELESLNNEYAIEVNRVNSFNLQAIGDDDLTLVQNRARELETAEGAAQVIDTEDITASLQDEIVRRYKNSEGGRLVIEFIRLGDIIDNIIQGLKETEDSPLAQRENDFEFITGIFTYRDAITGDRKAYNYSDMLISIDAFRIFFVEKIIRPLKVKYNLTNFIIDLVNKFSYVNSLRLSTEETFVAQEGRPVFSVFQGPDIGLSSIARAVAAMGALQEGGSVFDALRTATDPREAVVEASLVDTAREVVPLINSSNTKFYFVLRSNNDVISRQGNEEEDIENGIYHLKLGSDKGILKSINFTRDEIRGRREGRIVRAGSLNINVLREKYDASITIFGAPFIFPGMYIYIDPNMIGMGSGTGANDVSAARVLGLGGYYFINKVSNSISSDGNFETQLEASWNSFGPPDCSLPDIVTISPQSEAIYEIGAADQVSGGVNGGQEESQTLRQAVEASPAGDYVEVIQVPGVDPVVVPRLGSTRNF